ncbi:19125_t:CDS:2 [Gigaspora margarita]|uniref:19125_t:CDS:1 n=1 Tax=Gigaspora margarita TaxID=4874 RepID=A0ABN7VRC8_GIGMA|nr:19125_t:CDS:2 [Gigaspora margarita]
MVNVAGLYIISSSTKHGGRALYYILAEETWWPGSIFMFPEHKYILAKETLKGNTIKNVWGKYNLAKEGKDVEEFFKFLKTIKNISNLTTNSDNNVVKTLCNWIQFSDLKKDDVILSGVIDTRKFSRSLKAHLELRDVWHLINEDIVVHDIPIEFEKHIERVVLDDDDRILDEYYNNSSNRKFMKEEFRCLNNLIYKVTWHRKVKDSVKNQIKFLTQRVTVIFRRRRARSLEIKYEAFSCFKIIDG